MGLTDEQRKRVEQSAWIVNSVLKEQQLSYDEDLRQEGLLWLCKCAQRFDPTRGVKWSTYAYGSVFLRVKRLHDIARIDTAKYACYIQQSIALLDRCLFARYTNEFAKSKCRRIARECSEDERTVLTCKYLGYTWEETAQLMGKKHRDVTKIWKEICARARGEEENNG